MQKSGFFNAILTDGDYDRKYNANDYSDNLAVVISNGVLRSIADDLKVTASGMVASVSAGRAWIKGRYYYNDASHAFAAVSAPTGGTRYDRVILRLDTDVSARTISLVYRQGTASNNPVKPALVRTGSIYELCLADIFVGTNATGLVVTDTRADADICGWLYSTSGDNSFFTTLDNNFNEWFEGVRDNLASVTLFKRYKWRTVLLSETTTVAFSIPQYDPETCFGEVYVNGILDTQGVDYTLSGSVITFSNTIVAGTEIEVNVYKSIDGTGIMSVADEITELQNQVAAIESAAEFNYNCINSHDNVALSEIVQAIYAGSYVAADISAQAAAFLESIGGNTYLASIATDAQITINVVGKLGASTPFSGSGTAVSPYVWFVLGGSTTSDKRIIFDFAKCSRPLIWCATNTENIIISGTDIDIRNIAITAKCNAVGCGIDMIRPLYNTGRINVENAYLYVGTTGKARIATNGTFTNCWCYCSSSNTHALMFCPPSDAFIRLNGGTYYAYTASFASESTIFYTYGTEPNAVAMAYNISCPVKSMASFYQKHLSVAYAGNTYINGVVSTLTNDGSYTTVVGKIEKNKN